MNLKKTMFICFFVLLSPYIAVHAEGYIASETFDSQDTVFVSNAQRNISVTGSCGNEFVVNKTVEILPEDGILRLKRTAEDGIVYARCSFLNQSEGLAAFDFDMKANADDISLFHISKSPWKSTISAAVKSGQIYLNYEGREFLLGKLKKEEWQKYHISIDFDNGLISAKIDDGETVSVPAEIDVINTFEMILSGDMFAELCLDNFKISNEKIQYIQFSDILGNSAENEIYSVMARGIMGSMGDDLFEPDSPITRAQMAKMITKALKLDTILYKNIFSDVNANDWFADYIQAVNDSDIMKGTDGLFRPNDFVSFEEAAKLILNAYKAAGGHFEKSNVADFELEYIGADLTDEELVTKDADFIDLGNTKNIFSDLTLPQNGMLGSQITWKSDTYAIDETGKIIRDESQMIKATLTATITKGSKACQRNFEVTILPSGVSWKSAQSTTEGSYLLVPAGGENVEFSFDIVPKGAPLNAVIGFTDRENEATSFPQIPLIVRLNEQGFFDAYDKNQYFASQKVTYEANKKYTIRMIADMYAKTYSVWIKPYGGREVQIASNIGFRASAPVTDTLGKIFLRYGSNVLSGEIEVTRHSLAAPESLLNADNILFDKNYAIKNKDKIFDFLSGAKVVKNNLVLPKQNMQGNEIVWFSSNRDIISDDGMINPSAIGKSEEIKLTAVINDSGNFAAKFRINREKMSDWSVYYIINAVNYGLIKDIIQSSDFNPKQNITRVYGAVLIDRLLQEAGL